MRRIPLLSLVLVACASEQPAASSAASAPEPPSIPATVAEAPPSLDATDPSEDESTTDLDRVRALDRGRALFVKDVRLEPGASEFEGQTQGREHGVRMEMRQGQVLRLQDRGGDRPGVELIGPDAHSAWIGILGAGPVDLAITSTGPWELDFLGYAGAQGRNSYDVRIELVPAARKASAKVYRGRAGQYPSDLLAVPEARNAFVRALGENYERFWHDLHVQSPMVEVSGRWLIGQGCLENACPDGGSWFVVDVRTGAITASLHGNGRVRTLAGRPSALPPEVRSAVVEAVGATVDPKAEIFEP
jgi:hypothetical protein